jgi:hypothetical protein
LNRKINFAVIIYEDRRSILRKSGVNKRKKGFLAFLSFIKKENSMMKNMININNEDISSKIYTIRNVQVMLDKDLANLYQIETRVLKQAVKRNIERFPEDFMFELNDEELNFMVSQFVIPSKSYFGGAKPFAFTEQGVSMLSAILKSKIAIDINIKIIRTFVNMRKFLNENGEIFKKIDSIEKRQIAYEIKTDSKIENILNAIEDKSIKKKQGIFYNGQIFDAYIFVTDLIKKANKSIILIDNFIDETVLLLLTKREKSCNATIYTKNISKQLKLDLEKHNLQYPKIEIKEFKDSHDRFLIIDNKEIYHIGASLKDLGKKWFAFSKLEIDIMNFLNMLFNERK